MTFLADRREKDRIKKRAQRKRDRHRLHPEWYPAPTVPPPVPPPDPTVGAKPVNRVSPEKATEIIRLKRIRPDITLREIASVLGLAVSTVSVWLRALEHDTVPEARKLARSNALRATLTIASQMEDSDPRVSQGAAKAITALAGVQETGPAVQVGVQVMVGQPGHPVGPNPFAAGDDN